MEDGWIRFMVWADSGTDTRESLYAVAAHNHWPLRSLFRHEATLEDVFVELTRKD
jgi:ABC-2 type transport system ATP-binding protein